MHECAAFGSSDRRIRAGSAATHSSHVFEVSNPRVEQIRAFGKKPLLDSGSVKKQTEVLQETRNDSAMDGSCIGTFTLVVAACSMTGHYRIDYTRMQRMKIFEYANRNETSVS